MIVTSEFRTIGSKFNEKWQAELIRVFGLSVNTKVRNLWVVDNPAASYQFQEQTDNPDMLSAETELTNPVHITWQWFSADDNRLSKIRLDYHADDDILYILNQEHRGNPQTVYDVIKSSPANENTLKQRK